MDRLKNRLKQIFNTGEARTFAIAEEVGKATGTRAFAKVRIADVITIANSGISDDLYKYALSGHFDILVYKNELPYLAIEFDGSGHDGKNDVCFRQGCVVAKAGLFVRHFGATALGCEPAID
jgi:hypothetical protein